MSDIYDRLRVRCENTLRPASVFLVADVVFLLDEVDRLEADNLELLDLLDAGPERRAHV